MNYNHLIIKLWTLIISKNSRLLQELNAFPAKTILLEKGKVADRLYLIHKGCLRLYFYNNGNDVMFQFFFENDIVASFNSLYLLMQFIRQS